MDDGLSKWLVTSLSGVGLHIMGSRTFRDMAAYWPTADGPIASAMNTIPKAVFSRSADLASSGATSTLALRDADEARTENRAAPGGAAALETWTRAPVRSGDLASEIAALKAEAGGEIMAHGGAGFAQSLVATGLIDEYRLIVHPVALGSGRSPFATLP